MNDLLKMAITSAVEAGEKIIEIYKQDFPVEFKQDNSPLTEADRKAHDIIINCLSASALPLLSEEGKAIPFSTRKDWKKFWLIDPLDGTKEFIKKNGEFTVNIALIKNSKPVLGVVYVPVTGVIYFGTEEKGSYRNDVDRNKNIDDLISTAIKLPDCNISKTYTVVASRSHFSAETETFINERKEKFGEVNLINAGSSIKLCLVAEGKANVYPRLAPTMEWDTAAGHAVAKFAGCKIFDFKTNEELNYNKENLLNPWFVVERN